MTVLETVAEKLVTEMFAMCIQHFVDLIGHIDKELVIGFSNKENIYLVYVMQYRYIL